MRSNKSNMFSFGFLILLSIFHTDQCCEINSEDYFTYVTAVNEHFRNQIGWHSLSHISVANSTINQVLEGNNLQVWQLYNTLAEVINYRYAEILKKFFIYLTDFTNECHYLYGTKLYVKFVNCVVSLHGILNYSETLFEKLYAALTFLSLIDMKFMSRAYENFSNYIVDEIYYVRSYIGSIDKGQHYYAAYVDDNGDLELEKALRVLESVANVSMTIMTNLIDTPPEGSAVYIDSTVEHISQKEIYQNHHSEEFTNFVRYMCALLERFTDETVQNDFTDLGFPQLLYPTSAELIPPHESFQDAQLSAILDYKIDVLNYLFKQKNWENMNHISIIYNDRTISANRVIRDEVNVYNFYSKKSHMTLMLRCRFLEILKNFDTILITILQRHCRTLRADNFNRGYYSCVAEFSHLIDDSRDMLQNLLNATEIFEELGFCKIRTRSNITLGTIKAILQGFIYILDANVPLDVNFVPDPNTSRIIADAYVEKFIALREPSNRKLGSEFIHRNVRCNFGNPFLANTSVETFFNSDVYNVNPSGEPFYPTYRELFMRFKIFCEKVISDDYYAFGFQQIRTMM